MPAEAMAGRLRSWLGAWPLGRGAGRRQGQVLTGAVASLRQLSGGTEDDFLRLGAQVQEFFLAAQAMTEQGSQVVELVSGQAVSQSTQRLGELIGETETRFQASQQEFGQSLEILDTVRRQASQAGEPLAGFRKMVMGLRVLGIATRMESARLQGQDEGFQFLSEEVSRLSDTIQTQTEGIGQQLRELGGELEETLGSMAGLGATLNSDVGSLVAAVGQSLGLLAGQRGQSEQAAAAMAAGAQAVRASMGQVVASQQFHDITRQRLEHVQEALEALTQGRGPGQAAQVVELQMALLEHAVAEMRQAAQGTQASLRGIAQSVRGIAQEAQRLMRGDDQQETSYLARLEADLASITGLAAQMEQASARLRGLVESVVGTLEKVGSSLRSIDNISYSIKFVALNAAIKSARLGSQGSALASLAQAIQQLSAEAQATTQALGQVLETMGESAVSLRQAMSLDEAPAQQTVQELRQVLAAIQAGGAACDELLAGLERQGSGLAEGLEREAQGIVFHLRLEREVAQVVAALKALAVRGKASRRAGRGGQVTQLAQSYTMASERQIHQAWSQGQAGPAAARPLAAAAPTVPEPELFAPPAPEPELFAPEVPAPEALAQAAPPAGDDLGDNVELF